MKKPFYLLALEEELEKRQNRNSQYSQRSFARAMDISPSMLHAIMSGDRLPGRNALIRIVYHISDEHQLRVALVDSVLEELKRQVWEGVSTFQITRL